MTHHSQMPTNFYRKLMNPLGLAVLDLSDFYERGFIITRINVPAAHRNKGIARELLKECCDCADIMNQKLWLEIVASGGLSRDALEAWYRRAGFTGHSIFMRKPVKDESNVIRTREN